MASGKFFICVPETAHFDPARRGPTEAESRLDRIATIVGEAFLETGTGTAAGTAKITAKFGAQNGHAEAFSKVGDHPIAEQVVRTVLAEAGPEKMGEFGIAAVFDCADLLVAESIFWGMVRQAGLEDGVACFPWPDTEAAASDDPEEAVRSIEVYYNIDEIPPAYKHPLDFRNEAMELVEQALEEAGAGEWSGAEIGMGEVNFGFDVEDFERAEKIVRAAVKGTPFEGIREITRFTYPDDLHPQH